MSVETETVLDLLYLEMAAENPDLLHLACPHCGECVCGDPDIGGEYQGVLDHDEEFSCEICNDMDILADYRPVMCKFCGKDIGI